MVVTEEQHVSGQLSRAQALRRFSRQLVLDGVGRAGQEAWLRARVDVRGQGPAAWLASRYLSAAGVQIIEGAPPLELSEPPDSPALDEAIRGTEAARKALLEFLPGATSGTVDPGPPTPGTRRIDTEDSGPLVVVVGAGGLGCPALLGLLWSGVRRIRIVDDDVVELSNLPRQILHGDDDLGRPKAVSAADFLEHLDHDLDLDARVERLGGGNYERLLGDADLILDGSDNFPTKFRVNAAARLLGIPAVIGGVIRYEGQCLAVASTPDRPPCYRCFFPRAPRPGALPTCSTAGVLGPVAGAVGLHQVSLGLALLRGDPVAGRLWLYSGEKGAWTSLTGRTQVDCIACGLEADDPALRDAAEGTGPACGPTGS